MNEKERGVRCESIDILKIDMLTPARPDALLSWRWRDRDRARVRTRVEVEVEVRINGKLGGDKKGEIGVGKKQGKGEDVDCIIRCRPQ